MGDTSADTQYWIARQLGEVRSHEFRARAIKVVDQEVAERLSQTSSCGVESVLEQVTSGLVVISAPEDGRVVDRVRSVQRSV